MQCKRHTDWSIQCLFEDLLDAAMTRDGPEGMVAVVSGLFAQLCSSFSENDCMSSLRHQNELDDSHSSAHYTRDTEYPPAMAR